MKRARIAIIIQYESDQAYPVRHREGNPLTLSDQTILRLAPGSLSEKETKQLTDDGTFLITLLPPGLVERGERRQEEVVVMDMSGAMYLVIRPVLTISE